MISVPSFIVGVHAVELKTDTIAKFKALCDAYPAKASYVSVGKSVQGNTIWAFCIGNPNSKGVVMWDGQLHGNEHSGSEIEYLFAKWLLTDTADSNARRILENNYVVFVPVVNIDSYERQNARRSYTLSNGSILKTPYGVNLGRNFVYNWGPLAVLGTGDPNSATDYWGLYAGSEPETQAMRNAFARFKPRFYVNVHQGGGPYLGRWTGNKNSTLDTATVNLIAQLSQQMGVSPYKVQGVGSGGMSVSDAGSVYGASAWLFEVSGSGMPTVFNYDNLKSYYFPKCLPILIAMCRMSENGATISASSEIVIDNAKAVFTGTWPSSSTFTGYYGSGYKYHSGGTGINKATWSFNIPTAGSWQVYARWTSSANRATNAKYTVNHASGSTTVTKNQEANGGSWQSLGTFNFNVAAYSVRLSDNADEYVIADAIRLVPAG